MNRVADELNFREVLAERASELANDLVRLAETPSAQGNTQVKSVSVSFSAVGVLVRATTVRTAFIRTRPTSTEIAEMNADK